MNQHETGRATRAELGALALFMIIWVAIVAGGAALIVLRLAE